MIDVVILVRELDAHDLGVGRDCRRTGAVKHSRDVTIGIAQVAGYKRMCFSHDL
jgi:hypothetical protein